MRVVDIRRSCVVPAVVLEDEMMDKKEALQVIEENLAVDYGNLDHEQTKRLDEAIDMAIGALKAQADGDRDTIHRQGSIKLIHKMMIGFLDESDVMSDRDKLILTINKTICNGIKGLPSAQPEKHTEERTETHACDLISR